LSKPVGADPCVCPIRIGTQALILLKTERSVFFCHSDPSHDEGEESQHLPLSIIARVLCHPFSLSLTENLSGARMLVMDCGLVVKVREREND